MLGVGRQCRHCGVDHGLRRVRGRNGGEQAIEAERAPARIALLGDAVAVEQHDAACSERQFLGVEAGIDIDAERDAADRANRFGLPLRAQQQGVLVTGIDEAATAGLGIEQAEPERDEAACRCALNSKACL